MGEMTRRRLLAAGAWAAPVIAVAIATPAAVASGDSITLVWTPSAVKYFEATTLVLNIPADSPYVGQVGTLGIFGYSGYGYVKNGLGNPWSTNFPDSLPFQTYTPPSTTLPAGQAVFSIQIAYAYPITTVQYYARLTDASNVVIAESSPITVSE